MKKILNIIVLIAITCCLLTFYACNKNKDSKFKQSKTKIEKKDFDVPLIKGLIVSGINLHDTANNIQGQILFPRISTQDYKDFNIKPINDFVSNNIKGFVSIVKKNKDYKTNKDHNILILKVLYAYQYKDITSCVFKKDVHLVNQKDTTTTYLSLNYNKNTGKMIAFDKMFNINQNNINDFKAIFGKELSNYDLQQMKDLDYNIEKDTISLNVYSKQSKKQIRLRQPLNKVASYIGNGN